MNRLNNYNWYMKYENIFSIEFFAKNGNFAFDPFFLCIWAEIPLYLKYGESRVDLSSKVKFFAFSHYTIPTELHSNVNKCGSGHRKLRVCVIKKPLYVDLLLFQQTDVQKDKHKV